MGQRVRLQIRGDDLSRPGPARREDAERADRPGPCDQHPLAQKAASPPGGVEADGKRLSHRRLAGAEALGRDAL